MKNILVLPIAIAPLLLSLSNVRVHEEYKNKKQDSTSKELDTLTNADEGKHIQGDLIHHYKNAMEYDDSNIRSDLSDFSTSALIVIVLVMPAYCVAHAWHYGAQRVNIEGIGPQGKFLEMEHHH